MMGVAGKSNVVTSADNMDELLTYSLVIVTGLRQLSVSTRLAGTFHRLFS